MTGGLFSTSAQATGTSAQSSDVRGTSHPASTQKIPITGDELEHRIDHALDQDDVTNVMDAPMRETVQNGTAVDPPHSDRGPTKGVVMTRGSPRRAKETESTDLAPGEVFVTAAQHTLETDAEVTAVAFATENRLLSYREYDTVTDGLRSVAHSWEISGETRDEMKLVLREASFNGHSPLARSMDACGPCQAGRRRLDGEPRYVCTGVSLGCVALQCNWCTYCGASAWCLGACMATVCFSALFTCCEGMGYECGVCSLG